MIGMLSISFHLLPVCAKIRQEVEELLICEDFRDRNVIASLTRVLIL